MLAPCLQSSARKGFTDCVRRRRWVRRKRQAVQPQRGASGSGGAAETGTSRRVSVGRTTVLGVVQPGGKLPLPYGWSSPGKQLQVGLLCHRR